MRGDNQKQPTVLGGQYRTNGWTSQQIIQEFNLSQSSQPGLMIFQHLNIAILARSLKEAEDKKGYLSIRWSTFGVRCSSTLINCHEISILVTSQQCCKNCGCRVMSRVHGMKDVFGAASTSDGSIRHVSMKWHLKCYYSGSNSTMTEFFLIWNDCFWHYRCTDES